MRGVATAVNTSLRALLVVLVSGLLGGMARAEIMPLDQVTRGMKGHGVTVFEGSRPERFDVEILGVLRNTGPNQNLILARVDHEVIGRAGVIAGMSGSPIYIDDKLIGALAYSWQFAKEPIAGITPIEEMLQIGEGRTIPAGAAPAGRIRTDTFVESILSRDPARQMTAAMAGFSRTPANIGGASPIAIPISFTNFERDTVQRFGSYFEGRGFMAVPSGTTGLREGAEVEGKVPFKPGDSIAGVLMSGDFNVASTGTVSHVDGDKVYAFGHPFLDLGEISFPMATSEVVTVLPNVARSFKMSNTGRIVGTFKQDRAAGILGIAGLNETMIPIELTVDSGARTKTYKVEVIRHALLSPLLIAMAADSVVASTQRAAGQRTVVLDSEIELEGFPPIRLQDGWAGNQAREAIPSYLAIVSSYLLSNEFDDASIKKVKIRLRHHDELRIATVTEATVLGDGQINPGETVRIRALLKPYRGEPFSEVFDLKIPDAQKPGPAWVFVGGGSAFNQIDFANVPPNPRTLAQVVTVVERLRSSTDLTVGFYMPAQGAVTAGVYMPDLPPSIGAVLQDDTSNSTRTPVRYYAPGHLSRPLDYIVDGWVRLELNIQPNV
jgi:hypothetical protein